MSPEFGEKTADEQLLELVTFALRRLSSDSKIIDGHWGILRRLKIRSVLKIAEGGDFKLAAELITDEAGRLSHAAASSEVAHQYGPYSSSNPLRREGKFYSGLSMLLVLDELRKKVLEPNSSKEDLEQKRTQERLVEVLIANEPNPQVRPGQKGRLLKKLAEWQLEL